MDKSCKERIKEEMNLRANYINELQYRIDGGEDSAQEELWDLPLSIETFKVTRVTFSTGGPADWIDIKTTNDGEIISVTYALQDWFDYAEEAVSPDSWLWHYAEYVLETVWA